MACIHICSGDRQMSKRNNRKTQSATSVPPVETAECTEKPFSQAAAAGQPLPKKPSRFIQIKESIKKKLPGLSKKEVELNNNHPIIVAIVVGLIVLACELLLGPLINSNPNTPPNSQPAFTAAPDNSFIPASLRMPLATRSGPSTKYDETGCYFSGDWEQHTVNAIGKEWDGEIWWVLVDFSYDNQARYRVWTGSKRIDINVNQLNEIHPLGQGTVHATHNTYHGPGSGYAKASIDIQDTTDVWIYSHENGYTEIEFDQDGRKHRLWVPENLVY